MGMLDHQKTWRVTVAAPGEACEAAFRRGLTKGKGIGLMKGKFTFATGRSQEGNRQVLGRYEGRGGLAGGLTALSERGTSEMAAASGSQVILEIEPGDGGRTICSVWLGTLSSTLGFTNDARFIRPSLKAAVDAIAALDASATVEKV